MGFADFETILTILAKGFEFSFVEFFITDTLQCAAGNSHSLFNTLLKRTQLFAAGLQNTCAIFCIQHLKICDPIVDSKQTFFTIGVNSFSIGDDDFIVSDVIKHFSNLSNFATSCRGLISVLSNLYPIHLHLLTVELLLFRCPSQFFAGVCLTCLPIKVCCDHLLFYVTFIFTPAHSNYLHYLLSVRVMSSHRCDISFTFLLYFKNYKHKSFHIACNKFFTFFRY